MMQMQPPLVGTFQNSVLAEHAIDELKSAGFSSDEINYAGHPTKGGFFDNLKTWFSGEDATPESVANNLRDLGLSEGAVTYYVHQYEAGDSLVAVNSAEHEQDAFLILRSNGAYMFSEIPDSSQVPSNEGTYRQDTQKGNMMDDYTNKPPMNTNRRGRARADEGETIHLRGERLQAEKRQVQAGEVWISKEVVAEEQSIEVPLTHEELIIEHHRDGERLSEVPVGQDERIHIALNAEQVDVTRIPIEMDEISVRKRNVEETKRFTDNVKHEEVRFERTGNVDIRGVDEEPGNKR